MSIEQGPPQTRHLAFSSEVTIHTGASQQEQGTRQVRWRHFQKWRKGWRSSETRAESGRAEWRELTFGTWNGRRCSVGKLLADASVYIHGRALSHPWVVSITRDKFPALVLFDTFNCISSTYNLTWWDAANLPHSFSMTYHGNLAAPRITCLDKTHRCLLTAIVRKLSQV